MAKIDSTLVLPYHQRSVFCLGCREWFITRYYGDPLDNLIAGALELFVVETHVKNCFGKENRG